MSSEIPSTTVEPSANQSPESYQEKTNRILAWGQLLKAIAPIIWIGVIAIVILPLAGQFFIHQAFDSRQTTASEQAVQAVTVQPGINWIEVDEAIASALHQAHDQAEAYAAEELNHWTDELMVRVDDSFLDWYFGYFNQKQIELKTVMVQLTAGVHHLLKPETPTAAETVAQSLTQDFQTEFAKRVLQPQIAQFRLEQLTQKTVQTYLNQLTLNLEQIPLTYEIPQGDWNRYLKDIAISIQDTEGQVSTLSLKVLVGGSAYFAVKPILAPLMLKVGSKIMANAAGKAGSKIALKAGANLTGKMAAGLLDCTVGVGILLWDVWDTYHTAAVEKPILRELLAEYLEQVKGSILENPETGIMTAIDQIDQQLLQSISTLNLAT